MHSETASTAKAQEIRDWHLGLMSELPALEVVEAIKTRRRTGAADEDTPLATALHRQLVTAATELLLEADAVTDEMIQRLPDDVLFPISKIILYFYFLVNPEKALEASDIALARAERIGFQLRQVLELRERIFRALGRFDEVEQTRDTINNLQSRPYIPDPDREREHQEEMDRGEEVFRWCEGLMRELPVPEALEAIKARWRAGVPGEDPWLASKLRSQLTSAAVDLTKEAEAVIEEMIARLPDDVRFVIAMTRLHHYHLGGPGRALEYSDEALARAERTGLFRREVLGTRARIFLDLRRFDELNQALEAIMALETSSDAPDIPPERDFVDDAPPGAIRPDVLARYNAFRPKRDDE